VDIAELFRQGAFGILAGAAITLYLQERKDRKELQKEKDVLMEARRSDAAEVNKLLNSILPSISEALALISKKIKATKESE
jgi:hypothetical protein